MEARVCTKCGAEKPLSDFSLRAGGKQRRWECKSCTAEWQRQYRKNNKDKLRGNHAKWRYGLSKQDYDKLIAREHCDICRKELGDRSMKHIDHCHTTGAVRGVLCSNCNTGLGLFRDNINSLSEAIAYLQRGEAL